MGNGRLPSGKEPQNARSLRSKTKTGLFFEIEKHARFVLFFFPRDLVATPAAQHTQPTALLCGYFGRLAKKPHRQNNAKDRPKTHSAHCAGCWLHPQTAHAARSARFASPAAHTARSACATRVLANAARRPTRRRLLANSPKTARERTQPVVRSACFIHRGRSSAQRQCGGPICFFGSTRSRPK